MASETIIVERHGRVGLIRLNRPEALNAINAELMNALNDALDRFEDEAAIGAIVLTGSAKAFAAGADIKEMQHNSFSGNMVTDFLATWQRLARVRKPTIAAVAGFALGGGCELALMCDFIIAADTAKFGQPEIKLGIMPGAGGSQRLSRAIGKPRALELCLTGRMIDAAEADRIGLVVRVVPADQLEADALKTASTIAEMSLPAALLTKEAINRIAETNLAEGLLFERRAFQALFATHDQKEGMAAFVEKRPAKFEHR